MEDLIKDKVKSIQCKTKTLKTMAVNVPELSLLNSVDKTKLLLKTDSGGASSRTKIVPIDKTGSPGASIECSTVVTASTPISAEKSASTVASASASATTEDNLLISVKNTSLIEDETMPDRVVQHMDGAVIVTVIEIFFCFSYYFFVALFHIPHSICPFYDDFNLIYITIRRDRRINSVLYFYRKRLRYQN